jgi:hypothetical protein
VPRTQRDSRATATRGRGRGQRSAGGSGLVIGQISQLVTSNESLQRENRDLQVENQRLKTELREIGDALGKLTGGPRGRRGRRGAPIVEVAAPPVRRQRRPITDPEVLERRRQALTKARAARAEKLAAAKLSEAQAAG